MRPGRALAAWSEQRATRRPPKSTASPSPREPPSPAPPRSCGKPTIPSSTAWRAAAPKASLPPSPWPSRLGATIDTTASLCHAPSVMAQQQVGEGHLHARRGTQPRRPRHLLGVRSARQPPAPLGTLLGRTARPITFRTAGSNRFSRRCGHEVEPPRRRRRTSSSPSSRTATSRPCSTLRAMVRGALPRAGAGHGAPRSAAGRVGSAHAGLRAAGSIFFGVGLAEANPGTATSQALLQLVTDLNGPARWFAMRMRVQGNVVGADSVLVWQTGYPVRGQPGAAAIRATTPASSPCKACWSGRRPMPACWSAARRWAGLSSRPSATCAGSRSWSWTRRASKPRSRDRPLPDGGPRHPPRRHRLPHGRGSRAIAQVLPTRYPNDETVLSSIMQRVRTDSEDSNTSSDLAPPTRSGVN